MEPISEEQIEALRKIMELPLDEAIELAEDELDEGHCEMPLTP